eukprot:TRINITY_DN22984_c0_g1_i1.p1 TRINITY_DN22984_c0_g1~~TRINITY_DN22984_c0_g1_i1.p1  ORF type:complete len:455 (+),score=121.24 TRINITY_DN22984_c0_g1_i1:85-1365(+)
MAWVDAAVRAAVQGGAIGGGEQDPAACFVWNLSELRRTARSLKAAFPAGTLHAFAAKANSVLPILRVLAEEGLGCEAASIGEFEQGMRAFPAERLVFDSPCKTVAELRRALQTQCLINVDNLQELERVEQLVTGGLPLRARVGVRINPQTGAGALSAFSTGTATSKFGIGIEDPGARERVLAAFRRNSWLSALHIHTGSQGCGMDLMVAGVQRLVALAEEIGPQVRTLDIGGGLPVDFTSDSWRAPFVAYADKLRAAAPALFSGRYHIVTEFGRAVAAKHGALLSRVEYTKQAGGRRIVTQHAGVDLAIRTVWAPKEWPLRVSCYTAAGLRIPDGQDAGETDVAGPCCLGGDILAHRRALPQMEYGCVIAFKDVGAYYQSSYSYYNLRQAPALWAVEENGSGALRLSLLRAAESVEDTLRIMTPKL